MSGEKDYKGSDVIDSASHYFVEAALALEKGNITDCLELLDCVENELLIIDKTGDKEYSKQRAMANLMIALCSVIHSLIEKILKPETVIKFSDTISILCDEARAEFDVDSAEFKDITIIENLIIGFSEDING